jgi:2'-5' RNA ligase
MRIFIALPIPPDFFESAEVDLPVLQELYRTWRWVPENNLHVTLAFLGEIDDRRLVLAQEATEAASSEAGTIQFTTGPVITLPKGSPRQAHALALEITGNGKAQMAALAAGIEKHLAETGCREGYHFRPAKKGAFSPHITLARRGSRSDAGYMAVEPFTVNLQGLAEQVVVYKSYLAPANSRKGQGNGPRYTPLAAYPLLNSEF